MALHQVLLNLLLLVEARVDRTALLLEVLQLLLASEVPLCNLKNNMNNAIKS